MTQYGDAWCGFSGVGMDPDVFESVTYSAACPDCDAELVCQGVQALTGARLRWDVEFSCSACGCGWASCGAAAPPPERRAQLLAEHGPARLEVTGPGTAVVAVMRVLRAEHPGLDPVAAKEEARRVLSGDRAGTLPEMERLARGLRERGVAAVAVRP
ncbi:hypothetical protein [Streptomyces sp. NPDC053431]|uniref:hypothetical protein n=1 Tax=Streptomyces sp. NPDC053431 TaxID=3365703 RepID=UPI0037CF781F